MIVVDDSVINSVRGITLEGIDLIIDSSLYDVSEIVDRIFFGKKVYSFSQIPYASYPQIIKVVFGELPTT
jgi:hypothetical protein